MVHIPSGEQGTLCRSAWRVGSWRE